jgi:hypothetical protein
MVDVAAVKGILKEHFLAMVKLVNIAEKRVPFPQHFFEGLNPTSSPSKE